MDTTNRTATGFRNETGDGKVVHFKIGLGIACRTAGANRQASLSPREVNCQKCLKIIARIRS